MTRGSSRRTLEGSRRSAFTALRLRSIDGRSAGAFKEELAGFWLKKQAEHTTTYFVKSIHGADNTASTNVRFFKSTNN